MASPKTSVGYVLSLAVADQVFMGGAMVTDTAGLPLEFRYTEPVRATKLQRVLYGDVLEKYIHGDVIAANLIGKLEQKPEIFLTADPTLASVLQAAGKKTAALTATRVAPLKEFGAEQASDENEYLLQLSETGSPVRVIVAPQTEAARRAEITSVLVGLSRSMDLLEPLMRVETAIRMLWEDVPETPVTESR
jgi:hypothetical protein